MSKTKYIILSKDASRETIADFLTDLHDLLTERKYYAEAEVIDRAREEICEHFAERDEADKGKTTE